MERLNHVRAGLPPLLAMVGLVCLICLLWAAAAAFSVQPGPQHRSPRTISFTPGFWAALGCVACLYLVGKGFAALATGLAPKWTLLGLCAALPIGWAAAMRLLAALRRDFSGAPWLDGCLLGAPAGTALWSITVALFFGDVGLTFTGVLVALALAFAIAHIFRRKEPDHGTRPT